MRVCARVYACVRAELCPVCMSESLVKRLTFPPQDMAWKLSRPESPNVHVVPVHPSQAGDGGGVHVKIQSSPNVSEEFAVLHPLCLWGWHYRSLALEL